ncbi:MAG: heavy metal-responsive transcriptional regulator [Candidatus Omnitrophica bacterium]|nr:heavy metal-responsive transcriptional regulator [Candidatus Omnitrophota bacterium]
MNLTFIGALAKQVGVPIKTIRYYEDVGLLPKPIRTASGYRLYAPDTTDRLYFIKKAQSLGLRLEDVKEILDLADRGRCPCGHVQHLLKLRLQELNRKIADLHLIERRVAAAIRRGCPPRFKPHGKAMCPTIDRQPLQSRSTNKRHRVLR